MFIDYLLFSLEALFPVAVAVIFYVLKKHTNLHKINGTIRQIIYGVTFGGIAILGTHFGVNVGGATINARDAAVVIAGLVFGTRAGFIAGIIGGGERLIVGLIPSLNLGFTVIACSVSTFLAGVISGLIRHFIFKDKRPGFLAGFFVGFVIETFHLLMVFVTNANEYQQAFKVVLSCTVPMLIANSVAVLLALLFVGIVDEGHKNLKKPDLKSINQRFVYTLGALTSVAFILSSLFVFLFEEKMATKQTNSTLEASLNETTSEIGYKTIEKAYLIKEALQDTAINNYGVLLDSSYLEECAEQFGIVEINFIDEEGTIQYSNEPSYVGVFNMTDPNNDTDQPKLFFEAFSKDHKTEFVQDFREMSAFPGVLRKYAGVKMEFKDETNGVLQIGFDKNGVDKLVENSTQYKTVGQTGTLLVLNDNFKILSKGNEFKFEGSETPKELVDALKGEPFSTFEITLNGVDYLAKFSIEDSHYIISLLPVEEANLMRNIIIFITMFLEVIVFGALFLTIYVLVKQLVINRIEYTNQALSDITSGNLDTKVEGGEITEFKSLSNGINQTVDALKGYIDAANKRIDEELAMAKTIQAAVLPSTFPAFPDHKEFDVHASMHPAKEVGGDFYDFYFSNSKTFHITIADVSGKGIPAALFMMRAKSILKSLSQTNMEINNVFQEANNTLCDGNEAGMFVTAWSASINLVDGTLSYANGGHNPPLIKHANGKFEYVKSQVNLVLAAMEGMPYGLNKVKLEPGDIVYLYTDGVTEGVNTKTEQFGETRLQNALNKKEFASCKEICDYVYKECIKFADGAPQFDDITMLAFKYNGK